MDDKTLLDIAEAILKPTKRFAGVNEMRMYLFPSEEPSLESICTPEEISKKILADYSFYQRNLHSLGSKEICGVPILVKFVGSVAEILNKGQFLSELEFSVIDSKNPGKNPTTDEAVVAIHSVSSSPCLQPVVLREYKSVVHPKPRGVNGRDLILNCLFKDSTASIITRFAHVYSV